MHELHDNFDSESLHVSVSRDNIEMRLTKGHTLTSRACSVFLLFCAACTSELHPDCLANNVLCCWDLRAYGAQWHCVNVYVVHRRSDKTKLCSVHISSNS